MGMDTPKRQVWLELSLFLGFGAWMGANGHGLADWPTWVAWFIVATLVMNAKGYFFDPLIKVKE